MSKKDKKKRKKQTQSQYTPSVDTSSIYEDRLNDFEEKRREEKQQQSQEQQGYVAPKPKGFFAKFSEFVSGIASTVKSLFTSSSSSKNTNADPYDLDLNNPNVFGARDDNTTSITPEMVRQAQMEKESVPEVALQESQVIDTKAIKTSIAGIAPVIKEALAKDSVLGADIRVAAEKVQELAGQAKDKGSTSKFDENSLNEFKEAVVDLQKLTQSFKEGPADTTAYKLANLSDTVSKALDGVSMVAAPAKSAHSLSGDREVNMKTRASKINSAAKHFETGGVGKHAQKQKTERGQSQSKGAGRDSVSV